MPKIGEALRIACTNTVGKVVKIEIILGHLFITIETDKSVIRLPGESFA